MIPGIRKEFMWDTDILTVWIKRYCFRLDTVSPIQILKSVLRV